MLDVLLAIGRVLEDIGGLEPRKYITMDERRDIARILHNLAERVPSRYAAGVNVLARLVYVDAVMDKE